MSHPESTNSDASSGVDIVGPSSWAPLVRRGPTPAPKVIDLEAEADQAGVRIVAALDALPSLLDTAVSYVEIALTRLRELALVVRADTALEYEHLGGVSAALELSHILQHLAGALDQVAGAQVMVARANISEAAEGLVDWGSGPIEPEGGSGTGSGGGEGGELQVDEYGGEPPAPVTVISNLA